MSCKTAVYNYYPYIEGDPSKELNSISEAAIVVMTGIELGANLVQP